MGVSVPWFRAFRFAMTADGQTIRVPLDAWLAVRGADDVHVAVELTGLVRSGPTVTVGLYTTPMMNDLAGLAARCAEKTAIADDKSFVLSSTLADPPMGLVFLQFTQFGAGTIGGMMAATALLKGRAVHRRLSRVEAGTALSRRHGAFEEHLFAPRATHLEEEPADAFDKTPVEFSKEEKEGQKIIKKEEVHSVLSETTSKFGTSFEKGAAGGALGAVFGKTTGTAGKVVIDAIQKQPQTATQMAEFGASTAVGVGIGVVVAKSGVTGTAALAWSAALSAATAPLVVGGVASAVMLYTTGRKYYYFMISPEPAPSYPATDVADYKDGVLSQVGLPGESGYTATNNKYHKAAAKFGQGMSQAGGGKDGSIKVKGGFEIRDILGQVKTVLQGEDGKWYLATRVGNSFWHLSSVPSPWYVYTAGKETNPPPASKDAEQTDKQKQAGSSSGGDEGDTDSQAGQSHLSYPMAGLDLPRPRREAETDVPEAPCEHGDCGKQQKEAEEKKKVGAAIRRIPWQPIASTSPGTPGQAVRLRAHMNGTLRLRAMPI